MVDAADHDKLEAAKTELLGLLGKPQLAGIPVSSNNKRHKVLNNGPSNIYGRQPLKNLK